MNKQLKFHHHINKQNKNMGGLTIGWAPEEIYGTNSKLISKHITVSAAFCSNKDTFCKKKGREICQIKANTNNSFIIPVKGNMKSALVRFRENIPFFAKELYTLYANNHDTI